ncbi:MAG: S9 family peptidase [Bacteroidales bacterium]|nr:S9 family peptidase [Bacteroidales bacterium]
MKKLIFLPCLLLTLALQAQKKPLDHSVFDSWQAVANTSVSASGKVVSYEVNPQEGDGTLTIRIAAKKGERTVEIPRGYRTTLLDDDSYAVCLIKAPFKDTRKAKIDGKKGDKLPQDSLAVINLSNGAIVKYPNVKSYKVGRHALQAFAFAVADTVLVHYFADGGLDSLKQVTEYGFSENGERMSLLRKLDKKKGTDRMNVGFFDVAARQATFLPDTSAWKSLPVFDRAGERALFLSATDTTASGSKHASLYLWDGGQASLMAGPEALSALPQGWGITENGNPVFSHNGKRIFVGVQEFAPPKDTSLVSFETPGLDIWNWDADEIPPYQKANLDKDAKRTYPAELVGGKLAPFSLDKFSQVSLGDRGDASVTLVTSHTNPLETQWNIQDEQAFHLVVGDVRTEPVKGAFDEIRLSPLGKYVTWWDYERKQWFIYDVAARSYRPLIEGGVIFWDEENDRPMYPDAYGMAPQWVEDDSAVLVYDRYDIWEAPADGSAPQRLTFGREKGITYRVINLRKKDDDENRHLGLKENLLLSVFDNATKENGVATLQLANPSKSFRTLAFGPYSWSGFKKADKADVYLFQKGNFRDPMDLYASSAIGRKDRKLTAINPQIADYNWGTAELYHWTAFDGTPLDGLLYKPEDFSPEKKYPVICYFYEKNSENLYTHYTVQPMWSIINIPFFVSRGYVVFVPDIVYKGGIPGECAYNCIVSGAQSLWQFPWIDRDNMAIQGQSWGGYQVAYLITRTGMFKAAGAGAPVANMTSAYGGIRWESGMSRQFQYEQTQSRIGRDLWNGIELYMENSPLFKLPNVTTPVLIMHNDADGAVPWYQGIELFMGLRRLGKPAWLLEYNDEAHNLRQRRNRKDLSIRLQQFFDYYLKGEPQPAWMRDGVPTAKKGYYFGYEY